MIVPGDPTTELLAALFMAKCQAFLDEDEIPLRCRRVYSRRNTNQHRYL